MRSAFPFVPTIELHGWDAHTESWHGPDELAYNVAPCRRILNQLRALPGSWYGRLRSQRWSGLMLSFCASIHDLGDAGLAVIDMDGSPGGPLQIILAVPVQRLPKVRADLAFEFVSFVRFLEGQETAGSELAIHDYIQRVVSEVSEPKTLVFSIESRHVVPEYHIVLSEQAEKLAICMIAWMGEKDAALTEDIPERSQHAKS
jgi:hypothetical protein